MDFTPVEVVMKKDESGQELPGVIVKDGKEYVLYQKTFRTDPISKHTIINRGQREKYLVSNNHPAIIDRDTFTLVQAEITRRSGKRKTSDKTISELGKYSGKYALSEILICGNCGSPYKRKTWTKPGSETRIYWRCLNRIEHGKKYCSTSKGIEEKVLHQAICRALQKGVEESKEAYSLIKANLNYAISGSESAFDIMSIETQIEQKQDDVKGLIKLNLKSGSNAEKYEAEIAKIYSEIMVLREQLKLAEKNVENNTRINEEVSKAVKWLDEHELVFEEYDDVVVRRLVDTIQVNNDDTITLYLKGGVEINESI